MSGAFDLVIIGAGTGGLSAAGRAARLGLRTVLVEKEERLGGAGLLEDRLCRQILRGAAESRRLGQQELAWGSVGDTMAAAASREARAADLIMDRAGVTVLRGQAHLDGPGRVAVDADQGRSVLTAGRIILATGSRPASLPGVRADGRKILNIAQLAGLKELPSSLIIVGGGSVGVELANVLQTLGSRVTLVEMQDQVLPGGDPEAGAAVAQGLRRLGVRVLTGHKARQAREEDGEVRCAARCRRTGEAEEVAGDGLLIAVGRRPDTGDLGLDSCAAVRDKRGFIQTDGCMETAAVGHYAVGGVVATPALPHVAAREGWIAASHAAGRNVLPIRYHQVPHGAYGHPEAASVGLTEAGATDAGYAIRTGSFSSGDQESQSTAEGSLVFAKVIVDDPTGGLLGVHLVGPGANAMIGEAATALGLAATFDAWSSVLQLRSELALAVGEALLAAAPRTPPGG